jgi:tripartite-type tricarboxylate transporter receptor subunit TctC
MRSALGNLFFKFFLILSWIFISFFSSNSIAQSNYPIRPIRLIIPFPPGGGAEVTARLVMQRVSESLMQPIILESKAGAGGNIGAEFVAHSPADGYTLLLATNAIVVQPHLNKLNWNPIRDFSPVSTIASYALVVAIKPSLPFKTINELVAFAKSNPGQLSYGSSGSGGPLHIGAELFSAQTGIKLLHIPYKGNAPMTIAILSGDIDMEFDSPLGPLPNIKLGKVRALATTGRHRSLTLPDVPTVSEALQNNFTYETWNAIVAPSGTSNEIVSKLNLEITKAVSKREVQEQLIKLGYEPKSSSSSDLSELIASEYKLFGKLIEEHQIKPD